MIEASDLPVALAVLRVVRGWTQEDLMKASGVRVSAISEYERGKKIPELRTLRTLTGAMGYRLSAVEEAQIFVDRLRQVKSEGRFDSPEARKAEARIRELGMEGLAEVRWEIERVSSVVGQAVTRLLRLILLLVARLWARRDGEPAVLPQNLDMEAVYAILSERFDGGETDVAARHNEHQP